MSRFPYINMPFSYYRNSPKFPNFAPYSYPPYYNYQNKNNNYNHTAQSSKNLGHHNLTDINSCTEKQKNKSNSSNDDYLFDLFGLKLYFDDILILSLLFFLYIEGVKDEMLFISLLLLLIS